MTLVAIPNISEGRDKEFIDRAVAAIRRSGGDLLDVHSDEMHNRSVLTLTAHGDSLADPLVGLASLTAGIDLRRQSGVHPRLGGLDVCPIVPFRTDMASAVAAAREVGRAVAEGCDLPVYLYGKAATRAETRSLPELRRGGLAGLMERAGDLPPDFGPTALDAATGVVCVGARGPLIAFNVWIEGPMKVASAMARTVREENSGLIGVRALGFDMGRGYSQVSMNITQPVEVGIDSVYEAVAHEARWYNVVVTGTEIVGLVEERFLPDPNKEAARLLIQPGRTLESALKAV